MLIRLLTVCLCCALATACSELGEPEAQPPVDPNAFALSPGFAPDPQVKTGFAGGPVEANQRTSGCPGWIAPRPNHTLVLSAPIPHLRVVIHATQDPTLLVVRADGTHLCNDDSEGLNSMVEGSFPAGVHQVFVGTYSNGAQSSYSIGVSQGHSLLPSTIAAHTPGAPPTPPAPPPTPMVPPAPILPPPGVASGPQPPVSIRTRLRPDPRIQTSWAGGPVQASTLGDGCMGHLPVQPQHTLILRRPMESLRVLVSSTVDTTIRVQAPDGTVRCNDDTDGLNPAVAGPFAAGTHQIFVGTYSQAQGGAYRVAFSTRLDLTSAELAAMDAPEGTTGASHPPTYPGEPPPSQQPPPGIPVQPTQPLPPVPGTDRRVPRMMPGDMNPQGLTAAQRAAADANAISYYEAREFYRCRACMLEHDIDHCIYQCREPCLVCLSNATASEQSCGPPCGGRR